MGSQIMKAILYIAAIEDPQKAYDLEYDVIKLIFQKNHPGNIKEEIFKMVKRISKTIQEADERY